jgi:hypothetical protein
MGYCGLQVQHLDGQIATAEGEELPEDALALATDSIVAAAAFRTIEDGAGQRLGVLGAQRRVAALSGHVLGTFDGTRIISVAGDKVTDAREGPFISGREMSALVFQGAVDTGASAACCQCSAAC